MLDMLDTLDNENEPAIEEPILNFWFVYLIALICFISLCVMLVCLENAKGETYDLTEINYQLIEKDYDGTYDTTTYYRTDINQVYNYENFYDIENLDSDEMLILCDKSFFSWENTSSFNLKGYCEDFTSIDVSYRFSTNYSHVDGNGLTNYYYSKDDFLYNNRTFSYQNWDYFHNWKFSLYYNQQTHFKRFYNSGNAYYSTSSWNYTDFIYYTPENTYTFNVDANSNFSIKIPTLDLSKQYEQNDLFYMIYLRVNRTSDLKISDMFFECGNENIFKPQNLNNFYLNPSPNFNTFYGFYFNTFCRTSVIYKNVFSIQYILANNTMKDYKETIAPPLAYNQQIFSFIDNEQVYFSSSYHSYSLPYYLNWAGLGNYKNAAQKEFICSTSNCLINSKSYRTEIYDTGIEYYTSQIFMYNINNVTFEGCSGFYYNKSFIFHPTNLTFLEKNGNEVFSIDDRMNDVDTDLRTSEEDQILPSFDENKEFKLSGDWGYFDSIRKGINKVLEIFTFLLSTLYILFEPIYNYLSSIGALIYSPFDSIITDIKDTLSNLTNDLWTNYFESPLSVIVSTLSGLANSIYSLFQTVLDNIYTVLNNVYTKISDVYLRIVDLLNLFQIFAPLSSLLSYLTTIISSVEDLFSYVLTFIVEFVSFILNTLSSFIDLVLILIEVYIWFGCILILIHLLKADDYSNTLNLCWQYFVMPIIYVFRLIAGIINILSGFIP